MQRATLSQCIEDVPFWVNNFCWTYDPREEDSTLPFILYPRQREFLHWLAAREAAQEDGVAEKCRDVGFTWLCCAYAVHGWLFREGFRAGFGSRKLELVDTVGDPKSIFEKMRFLLDHLPSWMRPDEFSTGYCKLLNISNGSSISGEGGENIGRGDRTALYFVDEAAFLERSHRVEAALSQTSRCKIWVSTPNGQGNAFYRKRFSGRFPVFTFRWQEDPRKGEAWYQEQKRTLDPVTLAQEVEIDYAAAIEGICIPAAWVRAAVDLVQRAPLPQTGPLVAALDIAAEGANKSVLGFRRGVVVQSPILSWSGVSATYTAVKTREECARRGAAALNYDAGGGYGEPVAQLGREAGTGFRVRGLNGGEPASLACWPDGRLSRDKFVNARAEWWWQLRERFRKAWEFVEEDVPHPLEELISIPNEAALIADLSLPLVETAETGKVRLESKAHMRLRGVASPDFADMLAYLFVEASHFGYSIS